MTQQKTKQKTKAEKQQAIFQELLDEGHSAEMLSPNSGLKLTAKQKEIALNQVLENGSAYQVFVSNFEYSVYNTERKRNLTKKQRMMLLESIAKNGNLYSLFAYQPHTLTLQEKREYMEKYKEQF
jgi:hypothetical protein